MAPQGQKAVDSFSPVGPTWIEGEHINMLDIPDLQQMVAPVCRDAVRLVAPLLLPACHLSPLPSEVPLSELVMDEHGPQYAHVRSAVLPQQLMMLASTGAHA